MGKITFAVFVALSSAAILLSATHADYKYPEHVSTICGGTKVDIRVIPSENPYQKIIVLHMSRGTKDIDEKYWWDPQSSESFYATCFHTSSQRQYVVYKWGECRDDGDCLGIIDTSSLEILLKPSFSNREEAGRILGETPPFPEVHKDTFFKTERIW